MKYVLLHVMLTWLQLSFFFKKYCQRRYVLIFKLNIVFQLYWRINRALSLKCSNPVISPHLSKCYYFTWIQFLFSLLKLFFMNFFFRQKLSHSDNPLFNLHTCTKRCSGFKIKSLMESMNWWSLGEPKKNKSDFFQKGHWILFFTTLTHGVIKNFLVTEKVKL